MVVGVLLVGGITCILFLFETKRQNMREKTGLNDGVAGASWVMS